MSNPDIPAIPAPASATTPAGASGFMTAVKQGLEALAGVRGNMLSQAVVFRDLVRLGLVTQATAASSTGRVAYASPSQVASKFTTVIGDGSTTSFTLSHGLNTPAVIVAAYSLSSPMNQVPIAQVTRASDNSTTITFATAPAAMNVQVVILG